MWSEFIDLNLVNSAMNWLSSAGIKATLTEATDKIFASAMILKIYNAFASVGILLLLVYFSMDIFDKLSSENFTIDVLMLNMVKIVAGVALINNGYTIVKGLIGLSDLVIESIMGLPTLSTAVTLDFSNIAGFSDPDATFKPGDFLTLMLEIIEMFINTLKGTTVTYIEKLIIGVVGMVCAQIIAYQRAINLALRMLLCPIVFADVVGHGLSNKSMHYIKSIFGICLEGPIIILVVIFVNETISSFTWGVAFAPLIMLFCTVNLMFNASKIAKDVVGG